MDGVRSMPRRSTAAVAAIAIVSLLAAGCGATVPAASGPAWSFQVGTPGGASPTPPPGVTAADPGAATASPMSPPGASGPQGTASSPPEEPGPSQPGPTQAGATPVPGGTPLPGGTPGSTARPAATTSPGATPSPVPTIATPTPTVPPRTPSATAPPPPTPVPTARVVCQPTTLAPTVSATIQGNTFLPATITVRAGDVIRWTNLDGAPHNAQLTNGACATAILGKGESAALRFFVPGTYDYFCVVHPNMRATVVVQA